MTIFLVTGATGNLGRAALRSLLDRVPAADIRVLVRNPSDADRFTDLGIAVRIGDYSNRASLIAACEGVDRAIFVSSPVLHPVVRAAQHRAVVESAVSAGVSHIVYSSGMGAPHDPGHSAAEEALAVSGIPHAVLRNALYSDPFAAKAIAEAAEGSIRSASDGQPLVTAAIADLGEAAAIASHTPPSASLWELRGPAWTFDALAGALSGLMARPVSHAEVSDDETGPFAVLFPLIRRGVFAAETGDLAELLGRQPLNIAEVAEQQLR